MFVWEHQESRGLAGFSAAVARARGGAWSERSDDGATPAGDLRTLSLGALILARLLGTGEDPTSLVRVTERGVELRLSADVPLSSDPTRRRHQIALANAFGILAADAGLEVGERSVRNVRTRSTNDEVEDAGLAPFAVVALVTGGVVASALATYGFIVVGQKALEVVDRALERNARTQRVAAAAAEHANVLAEHIRREATVHGPLPFSEAETRALEASERQMQSVDPLPPLDVVKPPDGNHLAGAVAGAGFGVGALVLGAAALYLLVSKGR